MKKLLPKLIGGYLNATAWIAPRYVGKAGYEIFCTPLAPKVKPRHKDFLNTAEQFDFFTAGGVGLMGYRWGVGSKKILFLHGWQSHTYRWKKYIQSLPAGEYTILAFDAPAHGLSGGRLANIPLYSEAIQAFFKVAGSVDVVVSHSMGSFSMLHALHHNAAIQVGRIIVMGSPGEANDFVTFYKQYTGMSDRTFRLILDYFVQKLNQTPDYFSAPRFASTVTVPGVIIHDRHDEEAPYYHAERIHASWKNSLLITTEGMGHNFKKKEAVTLVMDCIMSNDIVVAKSPL